MTEESLKDKKKGLKWFMNISILNNYKTGIIFIDEQHYILFRLCDEINKNINDQKKSLELLQIFYDLMQKHFIDEEKFMEELNFPFIRYHKIAHEVILEKVLKFLNSKDDYSIYMQKLLLKTVDDSFLKHTDHYDFQFIPFYQNKEK